MIRFYKSIAKIMRTLKSYLTGAVLKMRYGFSLIIRIMLNWRKGFVSLFKTKPGHSTKRGVRKYSGKAPILDRAYVNKEGELLDFTNSPDWAKNLANELHLRFLKEAQ